jgi:hypothetical protein
MTKEQIRDELIRGVARSMEAEGANYNRVLKRMQAKSKKLHNKSRNS